MWQLPSYRLGWLYENKSKEFDVVKAAYLAMYCPDVSVSEEQLTDNNNTYDLIIASYKAQGSTLPTNINGKPFIRKLSDLYGDLEALLIESDIRKRTTVNF